MSHTVTSVLYRDIIDKKDDLLGIVLTHAHEDHIGGVAHIWPQLKCKISQHHYWQY